MRFLFITALFISLITNNKSKSCQGDIITRVIIDFCMHSAVSPIYQNEILQIYRKHWWREFDVNEINSVLTTPPGQKNTFFDVFLKSDPFYKNAILQI